MAKKKTKKKSAKSSKASISTQPPVTEQPKIEPKKMSWHEALEKIKPRIFKIRTPDGYGTGFHIGNFGTGNGLCAVATALHVINEISDWEGPLKLIHNETGTEVFLRDTKSRAIFPYVKSDLAIIVFTIPSNLKLPDEELRHIDPTHYVKAGVEIGWCGFPAMYSNSLCFFQGYISTYLNATEGYLADGVAINGVSGGPVFYIHQGDNCPVIAGAITAYHANRTMPGVSIIAPVAAYQETIKYLRTLKEASAKAEEQAKVEAPQKEQAASIPPAKGKDEEKKTRFKN